jgi:hypothetical protein
MQRADVADTPRRSSRLPISVPIRVTSLEPAINFSEVCETLVVNAHGCAMRSPVRLEAGVPLRFQTKEGRETMARVVVCQPMESDEPGWKLGVKLDRPENFWGLKPCPEEWMELVEMSKATGPRPRKMSVVNSEPVHQPLSPNPPTLKAVFDKLERQLSDDHLKSLLTELVRPLNADLAEMKEKLVRGESKRSRFEVSLSQIPPELEEQLWSRLRQELGSQALQQAREQGAQVFGAAKAAIEEKITIAQEDFRQRVSQDLQAVEQRSQAISLEMADTVRHQLRAGAEKFQQQALEAGSRLDRRGEEHLQVLHQRLGEEHDAYRREMEQVQAAVESKSAQLEARVVDLGSRTGKLDESVRRFESNLDAHLEKIAGDIVTAASTELDSTAGVVLRKLKTDGAKDLENQLDQACRRLNTIQKEIEGSISGALKAQVAEAMQAFEQTMEELAEHSVGRWRLALAKDLNSVATLLGEKIRSEARCEPDDN